MPIVSYALLALVVLFLIGAVIVRFHRNKLEDKFLRRIWNRVFACLLSAGLIGLVLYFFTWQRVPVFGMRMFWPIWLMAHLVWGYKIWARARRDIPTMQAERAKREAYEKWLPKAKRS